VKFVDENAEKIDNIRVNLLNDKLNKVTAQSSARMFEHKNSEKADNIPLINAEGEKTTSTSPQSSVERATANLSPDTEVRKVAEDYMKSEGRPYAAHTGLVPVNEKLAKEVADWYQGAKHEPDNEKVKASYEAFKNETVKQWDYLTKLGYKMEPWTGKGQPYKNSAEMAKDVQENKHIWFFPTEQGYGAGEATPQRHPLLDDSGRDAGDIALPVNDVFRAVHDVFGHAKEGYEFGPKGEYNAYLSHSRMYSDEAKPALAAETMGQNSWVNYGEHLRDKNGNIPKKGEEGYVPPTQRPFAEQKATVLPEKLRAAAEPNLSPDTKEKPTVMVKGPDGTEHPFWYDGEADWGKFGKFHQFTAQQDVPGLTVKHSTLMGPTLDKKGFTYEVPKTEAAKAPAAKPELTNEDIKFDSDGKNPRAIRSTAVMEPETGSSFEAPTHMLAYMEALKAGWSPRQVTGWHEGFVDNSGNFLDRRQAFQRAEETKQLSKKSEAANLSPDEEVPGRNKTFFVRHGATELNNSNPDKDRIRGHKDVPLSAQGRKEAEETANEMKDSDIKTIYTSDLSRAKDTADAIADKTGAKVITDERLRPWHFGPDIEGKPTSEMLPKIAELAQNPDTRPKGGETFNEFKDRFLQAYHEIQNAHPNENSAIVSHYRGAKLLEAWRAAGVDNDNVNSDVFTEYDKNAKPGFVQAMDKKGNAVSSEVPPGKLSPDLPKEDVIDDKQASRYAKRIASLTQDKGGASFDVVKGRAPTRGYTVSLYPDRTELLDKDELTSNRVADFIKKNKDLLSEPDHVVGTWFDKSSGKTYLDVSYVAKDENIAKHASEMFNQKAYWDIKRGKEVGTGGTGEALPDMPDAASRVALAKKSFEATQVNPNAKSEVRGPVNAAVPDVNESGNTRDRVRTTQESQALDYNQVRNADDMEDYRNSIVKQFKTQPGFRDIDDKDSKAALDEINKRIQGNLDFLYSRATPENKERWRKWYDIAHDMSHRWGGEYGVHGDIVAAINARLSPQLEWNNNVTLTRRVLDTIKKDPPVTEADKEFLLEKIQKPKVNPKTGKPQTTQSKNLMNRQLEALAGMKPGDKLSELNDLQAGMLLRSHNELNGEIPTHDHDLERVPGQVTGWSKPFDDLRSVMSIWRNPTFENVSDELGGNHKVRSFYNNHVAPQDPRWTTIDTHAVAGGNLYPYGGSDQAVVSNFGNPNHKTAGYNGVYPIYQKAYEEVAAKHDLLPRELQSIVWEQMRNELNPAAKRVVQKMVKNHPIEPIWAKVEKGELTPEQGREQIVQQFDKFNKKSNYNKTRKERAEKEAGDEDWYSAYMAQKEARHAKDYENKPWLAQGSPTQVDEPF